jgi:hypothetical protein
MALKAPLASPSFTGNVTFTLGSDAVGDMYYRAASTGYFTRLGIGSSGYRLGVSGGIPAWVASDTTGDAAKFAAKAALSILDDTIAVYTASLLPKASFDDSVAIYTATLLLKTAVDDSIDANTVAVQTSSGYRAVDSAGVLVNEGDYLLAEITLDSSVVFTSDTTGFGYQKKAVTVTSIVLMANGTVSLTPRFMYNDTLGGAMTAVISSPAALTTARTFVTLSSLNNTAVSAGNGFFLKFDAITTKPPKFTVWIYGHRTF